MTDSTPPQQPSTGGAPVSWSTPPPQPPGKAGGFDFREFLSFRYLITPPLMTVIYVIGAVLITLASLATLATREGGGVVVGLLIFVFGNLYWRVILEFVMVLFRMNDSLQSIEKRGRGM
jgi:hypothetical protein